jgi:hypothetical protein
METVTTEDPRRNVVTASWVHTTSDDRSLHLLHVELRGACGLIVCCFALFDRVVYAEN